MSKRARAIALAAVLGDEQKFTSNALLSEVIESSGDCSGGTIDPTVSGTPHCLNAITEGSGGDDRTGRSVIVDSLHITGIVYTQPVVNSNDPFQVASVFLALVQDKQTNFGDGDGYSALNLLSERVFSNPTADPSGSTTPLRNHNYRERYRVWRSDTLILPPSPMVVTVGANPIFHWSGVGVAFDWFVPVNTRVAFDSDSSSILGIVDNSFHMIAYTSSASTFARVTYNCAMRFRG